MSAAFNPAAGRNDRPAGLDLAPEVGRIELAIENDFVNLTEFRQGKLVWQELECDIRVADLVAQPPEGVSEDLVVIEGEFFWQSVNGKPTGFTLARRWIFRLAGNKGIIRYRDSVFPGITVGSPECVELLQVRGLESGFG